MVQAGTKRKGNRVFSRGIVILALVGLTGSLSAQEKLSPQVVFSGNEQAPGSSLSKEQLPMATVFGGWILHMGGVLRDPDAPAPAVDALFRHYGLDPESPVVQELATIHEEFHQRFAPAKLLERYRMSAKPEEVVARQWSLEQAQFLGRESGRWLAAIQSEGVVVDSLVRQVVEGSDFTMSIGFDGQEADLEELYLGAVTFQQELRAQLGRSLSLGEVEK